MPYLNENPSAVETYIFEPGGQQRPGASASLRLLLHLLRLPFMSKFGLIDALLRSELELPRSTSFYPGFRCLVGNLYCGENVGLCDTLFVDYAPVYIGEKVGFSFRNLVLTSTHDFKDFNKIVAKSVIIERNVWITTNVTILPGVRIGENSVIGAGSVVTSDIPPNVFAAGNPCRYIKTIQRGS